MRAMAAFGRDTDALLTESERDELLREGPLESRVGYDPESRGHRRDVCAPATDSPSLSEGTSLRPWDERRSPSSFRPAPADDAVVGPADPTGRAYVSRIGTVTRMRQFGSPTTARATSRARFRERPRRRANRHRMTGGARTSTTRRRSKTTPYACCPECRSTGASRSGPSSSVPARISRLLIAHRRCARRRDLGRRAHRRLCRRWHGALSRRSRVVDAQPERPSLTIRRHVVFRARSERSTAPRRTSNPRATAHHASGPRDASQLSPGRRHRRDACGR